MADDLAQQKAQIDEEARKVKEEADRQAELARQALADQEADRVRQEAEQKAQEIQNNAQS